MTILLHKPYLVKVTTKGEGGSKISKNLTTWFIDDPVGCVWLWPHTKWFIRSLSLMIPTNDTHDLLACNLIGGVKATFTCCLYTLHTGRKLAHFSDSSNTFYRTWAWVCLKILFWLSLYNISQNSWNALNGKCEPNYAQCVPSQQVWLSNVS